LSNTEWIEINRDALTGDLETRVQALLGEAFPKAPRRTATTMPFTAYRTAS
jgi:hypothetical protein